MGLNPLQKKKSDHRLPLCLNALTSPLDLVLVGLGKSSDDHCGKHEAVDSRRTNYM